MRSRYKITEEDGVYFVTSTVTGWIPVFTSREYFEIVVDALRSCQEKKIIQLLKTQRKEWLLNQLAFYKKKYQRVCR